MELQPREVLPKRGFTIFIVPNEVNEDLVDYTLADTEFESITANPYHPLETLNLLNHRRKVNAKDYLIMALPTLIPSIDGARRGIEGDVIGETIEITTGAILTFLIYYRGLRTEERINSIREYILKQMERANTKQLMEGYAKTDKSISTTQEPAPEIS